ncbi:MAG: tetratricopeptide repeat protein, partial [Flavobacteriales bacterium]|nr:tetratricopeptide repeat protein [Flavobacteriales bacterium]
MKKLLLLATSLSLFVFLSQSQNNSSNDRREQLDSLYLLISQTQEDSIKANNYIQIGKLISYISVDSAIYYYSLSKNIAIEHMPFSLSNEEDLYYKRILGVSNFYLGSYAQRQSNYTIAIERYNEAIKFQEETGDKKGLAKTYNYLSRIYERKGEYKRFHELNIKASHLQLELKDTVGLSFSLIGIASYFEAQKKTDSLSFYYEKAIGFLRKSSDLNILSYGLYEYANALRRLEKYQASIDLLFETLEIYEALNHSTRIAKTMGAIGRLYCDLNQLDKAEVYFNKLKELSIHQKSNELEVSSLNNFGQLYCAQGKHEKSLNSYQKVLSIIEKVNLGPITLASCLNEIGKQYEHIGDWKTAVTYFKKGIKVGLSLKSPKKQTVQLNNLSNAYLNLNELSKAEANATKSIKLGEEFDLPKSIMASAKILANIKARQKQHKEALFYYKLATSIKDSLANINIGNLLIQKEAEYKVRQKDQQIIVLEKEQEVQKLTVANQEIQLEKQRQNQLLLLLGVSLLISISAFFFNRYTLKQKHEKLELKAKRLELENRQEKT